MKPIIFRDSMGFDSQDSETSIQPKFLLERNSQTIPETATVPGRLYRKERLSKRRRTSDVYPIICIIIIILLMLAAILMKKHKIVL